jgi:hypothetical protein
VGTTAECEMGEMDGIAVAVVLYVIEWVLELWCGGDPRPGRKERIACDERIAAMQGYMPPMCDIHTAARLGCQGK